MNKNFVVIAVMLILSATMLIACDGGNNNIEPDTPDNPAFTPVQTVIAPIVLENKLPFSKGFAFNESNILTDQTYVLNEEYLPTMYNIGADVARIAISFFHHMDNENHELPQKMTESIVSLITTVADDYPNMYIIIDNHSSGNHYNTVNNNFPISYDDLLSSLWVQLATSLKDMPDILIYEIQNEPWVADWHNIQNRVIAKIREIDDKHSIVIVDDLFSSNANELSYDDDNLIMTVHNYAPFLYSHQGSWWDNDHVIREARSIPWPAGYELMPEPPTSGAIGWYTDYENGYGRTSHDTIAKDLNTTVKWANAHNMPLFVGEWGAIVDYSSKASRLRYYEFSARQMDIRSVARTSWGWYNEFRPFNVGAKYPFNFDRDKDSKLLTVMGYKITCESQERKMNYEKDGY